MEYRHVLLLYNYVGEMSGQGNVRSGKCPGVEVSVGDMSVRDVSGRVNVLAGNCLSGMCPVGEVSG